MFAHGTDADADGNFTGQYAITFGLYTEKDVQLRLYTQDISRIDRPIFAENAVSYFYACRTGNDFDNGNFAERWAWLLGVETWAYQGANGRSDYSDILGTRLERNGFGSKEFKEWQTARTSNGSVDQKPGASWRLPKAASLSSMERFAPMQILPG